MKISLFNDDIGSVEYITHMGDDLTIVNAARVSFGAEKEELDEKERNLLTISCSTTTLVHLSIVLLQCVLLFSS